MIELVSKDHLPYLMWQMVIPLWHLALIPPIMGPVWLTLNLSVFCQKLASCIFSQSYGSTCSCFCFPLPHPLNWITLDDINMQLRVDPGTVDLLIHHEGCGKLLNSFSLTFSLVSCYWSEDLIKQWFAFNTSIPTKTNAAKNFVCKKT